MKDSHISTPRTSKNCTFSGSYRAANDDEFIVMVKNAAKVVVPFLVGAAVSALSLISMGAV
ncbi:MULTISPECIES: hypothetical protein [unclassified Limnobacter]|uniref:hypothetical protein n=1 Tax=unclassified Limnobacter TaxID=2630203 RepID=UPI000C6BD026|nr:MULTISPECIES: hypothetical protein [unclassified Limnobacter]MAG80854.1 hypothetical protein [Sutterellaceae bacterium]HAV74126.1 hypothetical protein [Limnobacter sp.]|tara:strand:- start:2225 stop:2407 length:183 start_codon:yes stop_codon:yes gene_type:complete